MWLAAALLAAGAITGLLAGVFGVGGGAVAVPIFYELFRFLDVMGSIIARYAPADLLKVVFVIVAGISAIRLLFGKDTWRFGLEMPAKPTMVVYGWIIGVLSALMGIGGGQLSNLFMTFYKSHDPSGSRYILWPGHPYLDPPAPLATSMPAGRI